MGVYPEPLPDVAALAVRQRTARTIEAVG